jgi:hypothetical protein
MSPSDSSMSLTSLCIDQVKGWTRSSVVMTFLIAASELDISDPQAVELLRPFFHVLDKCWMVPVHVSCHWCKCGVVENTLYFLLLNNHVLDFYSCFWDCFLKFIFVVSHIHPCFGSTMC